MMFLFRSPDYTGDEIELYPVRIVSAEKELGFGHERLWRISIKGTRREIGRISYRAGESRGIFYFGHIGYHIDPEWQGHRYAMKACLLIQPEIRISGKSSVIITCDPDNIPSRRTCQLLGCLLEGKVNVPEDLQKQYDISPQKLRYIWRLNR